MMRFLSILAAASALLVAGCDNSVRATAELGKKAAFEEGFEPDPLVAADPASDRVLTMFVVTRSAGGTSQGYKVPFSAALGAGYRGP
ncbi:MAG: hypothetical protein AAF401_03035 [Pseudomonadota bacterium]